MDNLAESSNEVKDSRSFLVRYADIQPYGDYDLTFASAIRWLEERNRKSAFVFLGSSNGSILSACQKMYEGLKNRPEECVERWFADVRMLADDLNKAYDLFWMGRGEIVKCPRVFMTRPMQLIKEYLRFLNLRGNYVPAAVPKSTRPRTRNNGTSHNVTPIRPQTEETTPPVETTEPTALEELNASLCAVEDPMAAPKTLTEAAQNAPQVIELSEGRIFMYLRPLPEHFKLADLKRINWVLKAYCEDFDDFDSDK